MAGHSKWANIQHRKNRQDAGRGKLFTKLIREITVASKIGGSDPATNPRLRLAIDKALGANMSKDTVLRASQRGAGQQDDQNFEAVRYEGYGPGGAAIIIDCLTDNRNRTVGEIRHALTKCGGNLGLEGSVAYLFCEKGQIIFAPDLSDNKLEEKLMNIAIETGAEDVITHSDNSMEMITDPKLFENIKNKILEHHLQPVQAEITVLALTEITLDQENTEKMQRLLALLDDLDDVQNVYSNA